jgi:hypothetical protein
VTSGFLRLKKWGFNTFQPVRHPRVLLKGLLWITRLYSRAALIKTAAIINKVDAFKVYINAGKTMERGTKRTQRASQANNKQTHSNTTGKWFR